MYCDLNFYHIFLLLVFFELEFLYWFDLFIRVMIVFLVQFWLSINRFEQTICVPRGGDIDSTTYYRQPILVEKPLKDSKTHKRKLNLKKTEPNKPQVFISKKPKMFKRHFLKSLMQKCKPNMAILGNSKQLTSKYVDKF